MGCGKDMEYRILKTSEPELLYDTTESAVIDSAMYEEDMQL